MYRKMQWVFLRSFLCNDPRLLLTTNRATKNPRNLLFKLMEDKTYLHTIPRQSSLSASVHSKSSYFSGHFIFLKLKLTDIKMVVTSDVPDQEIFRMWFYDSAD